MKIAAHQPNYLPNMGFFYKMMQVDRFVVISNIQFEKGEGWQQRNKIKGGKNDIWLTVPVLGTQNQKIKDVMINNSPPWRRKHRKAILLNYGKTKEKELLQKILGVYDEGYGCLVEINFALISLIKDMLQIKTDLILDEEVAGEKHELLINICKKHEADCYLSGMGAKHYMTDIYFEELGKNEVSHEFITQDVTGKFHYSIIHYMLINGVNETKKMLS